MKQTHNGMCAKARLFSEKKTRARIPSRREEKHSPRAQMTGKKDSVEFRKDEKRCKRKNANGFRTVVFSHSSIIFYFVMSPGDFSWTFEIRPSRRKISFVDSWVRICVSNAQWQKHTPGLEALLPDRMLTCYLVCVTG